MSSQDADPHEAKSAPINSSSGLTGSSDGSTSSEPRTANENILTQTGTSLSEREQPVQSSKSGTGPVHQEVHNASLNREFERHRDILRQSQFSPTYADPEHHRLGCSHYLRRCKLYAECCQMYVTCRLCHDSKLGGSHRMDRFAVKKVLCMACGTEQDVSDRCVNPECSVERFARYYCDICHLYTDSDSPVYHCDGCGICRQGKREENVHCGRCNACVTLESMSRHSCMPSSVLDSHCPVCCEDMFTSRDRVIYLKCGHTLHEGCWSEHRKHSYTCPLCQKSAMDMSGLFKAFDQILEAELPEMPVELRNKKSSILCKDCGAFSVVPYHYELRKCPFVFENGEACGSFNTRVV